MNEIGSNGAYVLGVQSTKINVEAIAIWELRDLSLAFDNPRQKEDFNHISRKESVSGRKFVSGD